MVNTSEIRKGLVIKFKDDIFQIVDFQHVKPGKGNAFIRTTLKSLTTQRTLEFTFASGEKLDDVRIERRKYQYLYPAGEDFVFMNTINFDQINIDKKVIDGSEFVLEGMEVEILFNADEENILSVELPTFVIQKITYTEPGMKGDTVNNVYKAATVESGAEVKVPLFIDTGEVIKIDTRTKMYVERAK